jgi:hypothetical protein
VDNPLARPVGDVSASALSVARLLDRLPAGDFIVEIHKPNTKRAGWIVKFKRVERIREMTTNQETS